MAETSFSPKPLKNLPNKSGEFKFNPGNAPSILIMSKTLLSA